MGMIVRPGKKGRRAGIVNRGVEDTRARFNPRLVGSGTLKLWVRGDTVTLNSGNVSSWTDLSGNGNHLAQVTGGLQPLWVASSQNGKPGVRFDGSDDMLGPTAFTLNQPEHVWIVYKSITIGAAGTNDTIYDGNADGNMTLLATTFASARTRMRAPNFIDSSTQINNGTFGITRALFNGASSTLHNNNVLILSGDVGATNAGGFALGKSPATTRATNIEVCEVLVYAKQLGSSDISRVEAYLKARYAL